jgi:hypothetical protein
MLYRMDEHSTQLVHLLLCRVMHVLLFPKSLADRVSKKELRLLRLIRVPWCFTLFAALC